MENMYLDMLAQLGIGSAHPGGFAHTKRLLKLIPLSSQSSVLDAGCGTGRTAVYLANQYGCKTAAIDSNPLMIAKASRRVLHEKAAVSLIKGSVESLPYENDTFDVVLSESVIAFTNVKQTLAECKRVLRPGGYFACIEMSVEWTLLEHEEKELRNMYGTKEFLTEQQWYSHLTKCFSTIQLIEGSTFAASIHAQKEVPNWDVSPDIHPSYYNLLAKHEETIAKYQHTLGHRSFLCRV
ncbi:class I SAM-dependent methyltransferase [Ectobacillus polymachus]|uniref:class I SAM-dependent methyltransferase n=1 Tax=Ectobacillus polymachus TaxID=1508806 RepID=UPI003A83D650